MWQREAFQITNETGVALEVISSIPEATGPINSILPPNETIIWFGDSKHSLIIRHKESEK